MEIKFHFHNKDVILIIHTKISTIDSSLGNLFKFFTKFILRQSTSVKLFY